MSGDHRYSTELPWDGGCGTSLFSGARWRAVHMLILLLFMLGILAAGPARGQSTVPPGDVIETEKKKITVKLSRDQERLAEEYLDVLRQLRTVTHDYREFFRRSEYQQAVEAYLRALDGLDLKLEEGDYLEDLAELSEDLEDLRGELADEEAELRDEDIKIYRLSKSLRDELEALEMILEDELSPAIEKQVASMALIQAYVQAATAGAMRSVTEVEVPVIVFHADDDSLFVMQMPHGEKYLYFETPDVPDVKDKTSRAIARSGDKKGAYASTREFEDSVKVSSSSQPIYITNPTGDLTVSGWNRPFVRAVSTVSLSAASAGRAESQSGEFTMQVCPKNDGICVEMLVPQLSDPHTSVTHSSLQVFTPAGNPLVGTNSFGRVTIRDINADVTLTASHSPVEMGNIQGDVKVANNLGGVQLARVQGDIDITNAHSLIELDRCLGDITIEASFCNISLEHCRGEADILNSGTIYIDQHSGTITIENQFGEVEVMKVDGDLNARNSFKRLAIEDITGSADIRNANGTIEVRNVRGALTVNSTFGRIVAADLGGPVDIDSEGDDVRITLAETLLGPSTITSSSGTVRLSLVPEMDLKLSATTVGGQIHSYYPISIEERGMTKFADVSLGKASVPLSITGSNAIIIIDKASR